MSWEELGQRALSWAQEQGTLLWGEAKEPSIAEVSSEVKGKMWHAYRLHMPSSLIVALLGPLSNGVAHLLQICNSCTYSWMWATLWLHLNLSLRTWVQRLL